MGTANPQLILELSKGFFKRNNPAENLIQSVLMSVHNLLTFNSKMKLLKYKFMLAQRQFSSMEELVNTGGTEPQAQNLDRAF